MQSAKKVGLNSAYGALGNSYFRFFDVRQASAVTTAGQLSIRWIGERLNKYINKIVGTTDVDYIIASDTDSVYLKLEGIVDKFIEKDRSILSKIDFLDNVCESKIQPFIDKSFKELSVYTNAYAQKMFMKREVLADKGIWTAKKRYILNVWDNEGVRYKEPRIKITGLEAIKSSTPTACREKIREAYSIIMNKDESDMIKFISDFKKEFKKLNPKDISFPRGVNNLEKYTGKTEGRMYEMKTPIHVRGSILYNHLVVANKLEKNYPLIKEGEKIFFIYLKSPNPVQSNIISFPNLLPSEFNLDSHIDYETQFNKSFVEPMRPLLNIIDWKTEKVNNLKRFMKSGV
jgi:DNA polymerase elongation subunit (family B)